MSALMISQITVTDREAFQQYLEKTQIVASSFGAEMIFRGKLDSVLNGDAVDHSLVVVARFPDAEALKKWFHSPEYEALVPLREAGSHQIMTTYTAAE